MQSCGSSDVPAPRSRYGAGGSATAGAILAKVSPIRFFWIQATRHSCTVEGSFAITKRNCCGTKAGLSTSIAAPSLEMFRTTQGMTEPPDET